MPELLIVCQRHEGGLRSLGRLHSNFSGSARAHGPSLTMQLNSARWLRRLAGARRSCTGPSTTGWKRVSWTNWAHNTPSFDGLVDLSLRIDARLAERHTTRRFRSTDDASLPLWSHCLPHPQSPDRTDPEPMQLGHTKLSEAECQRCRDQHLCMYCGGAGNIRISCPLRAAASSVREGVLTGATIQPSPSTTQPIQSVRVTWKRSLLLVPVLIDSGADASFMCPTLVRHLGIPTTSLNDPVRPCALAGAPLDEVVDVWQPSWGACIPSDEVPTHSTCPRSAMASAAQSPDRLGPRDHHGLESVLPRRLPPV